VDNARRQGLEERKTDDDERFPIKEAQPGQWA
jgi:hypothetical protein